jgi:hypothetical protein
MSTAAGTALVTASVTGLVEMIRTSNFRKRIDFEYVFLQKYN